MKHLLYILAICFSVALLSSCQKAELDDLKPLKVNSEERVDTTPTDVSIGKGDADSDNDDNNGEGLDGITDDDDEDDDDEMEGQVSKEEGL